VLKPDGVLWLNLGDSYATDQKGGVKCKEGDKNFTNKGSLGIDKIKLDTGLPSKNLLGIPWRVAFALQDDGWILRSDIIWHKPNPMPESVTDRPTRSHEYIFLFSKNEKYYYNAEAIKEPAQEHTGQAATFARSGAVSEHVIPGQSAAQHRPNRTDKQRGHSRRHDGFNDRWDNMTKAEQGAGMRNKRDVWTVAPATYADAHFATFPPDLIEPCILAGSAPGDTVLDPFSGSGTTAAVALKYHRNAIGLELNPAYIEMSHKRIGQTQFTLPLGGDV
jgi:DNA modification methylase